MPKGNHSFTAIYEKITMTILYEKVALIGLGLIGSSLALAMKKHGLCQSIIGSSRTKATMDKALELGFIDQAFENIEDMVKDADLIVICTPLGAYKNIAKKIAPHIKPGATLTDVGSCKKSVIDDITPYISSDIYFIPGHPIAGTEDSGPEAGFSELFKDRYWILTPIEENNNIALKKLELMLTTIGAKVEVMNKDHHDRVLAITSHLPHIIAYTIVGTAADLESQLARENANENDMIETSEVIKFSASGFRDFTRIACSDPTMWRDIFLANKEASLEMLGRFSEDLSALQRAIRWGDGDKLFEWFTRTRDIRRGIIEEGQAGTFSAVEPETKIDMQQDIN